MTREQKRKISTVIRYTLLIAVGFIMVYPLIWMVGATFKTNSEIFTSAWFWPKNPVFDGYENAFKNYGGKINLILSMLNTYKIVIPKVVFTIVSATITAYGFARFNFKGKGFMFSMMMATLFLPQVVLNAPQYIMFNKWGWTNSYLPLVIPSLFAADTYFVFMLIQFLRGVPKELEEAAEIDGCTVFRKFFRVVLPLLTPVISTVVIIVTLNVWNEFMTPLLFLQSREKDVILQEVSRNIGQFATDWTALFPMLMLGVAPLMIFYVFMQKYIIAGVAAGAVKG